MNEMDDTLPQWANARIVFEAGDARWHLVVERGEVVAIAPGELERPDVTLRWQPDDADAILNGSFQGDDALVVTTIVDGAIIGPAAPLDLFGRPELAKLPRVPGASLRVQYLFSDGPFGDVWYALVFEDGRVAEQHLGKIEDMDVMVEVSYLAMAGVRTGDITIIQALEGGSIAGELGPLALLAGISESPEFHAAELATGRHAYALAALGQVWRRSELVQRMRDQFSYAS